MTQKLEIVDFQTYLERMLLVARPGAEKVLAFYEHRVGVITTDARLMLAPLDDHLCHRGDGVFESISFRQGRLLQFQAHIQRMQRSAQSLQLQPPCSWEQLTSIVLQVAAAAHREDGALRVLLGRGAGGFGVSPQECPESSLYVVALASTIPQETWYTKGLTACRSSIPAKQSYLAKIKNANYLPNVLMAEEALQKNVDVVFSFNRSGFLAEAAIANVAIITQDTVLLCPQLDHVLPGTTLMAALKAAEGLLPTAFADIRQEDIWAAKEVLLFGSTPLCVGITQYEGRPIADGTTGFYARALRERLKHNLLAEGTPF